MKKINKIVIITSLFGNRDELKDPSVVHDGIDYYAFVDRKRDNCKVWNQVIGVDFSSDKQYKNRRNAKIYKILPHLYFPEHDYHIWVDANWDVIESPESIIERYMKKHDIAVFNHTGRNCVYKELNIIRGTVEHKKVVDDHRKFLRERKYPEDNGLFAAGIIVRRNNDIIKTLNLMWYEQICKYSSRDQISFPYCLSKLSIEPAIFDEYMYSNDMIKKMRSHH